MGLRVCVVCFLVVFILNIRLYIFCCFFFPQETGARNVSKSSKRGAQNGDKIIPEIVKKAF